MLLVVGESKMNFITGAEKRNKRIVNEQNGILCANDSSMKLADEEELDLVYDPELNCYYDPVTHKYYELV